MYVFWHDYLKHKYSIKVKLCYMDTDAVYHGQKHCIQILLYTKKADDINKDIVEDVEKRFGTSKL